ncbi:MAG: DUF427 domain-containing protein [Gammaproteobacteria bacterium]|nr:DUF427 domain-containing protein [Gammaproteobacteria bacterium]
MNAASQPLEATSELQSSEYGFTFTQFPHHVRVEAAGIAIADSRQVMIMKETRLPPVLYFPRADVRMDLMTPTRLRTICPFKGNASYWSLGTGAVDNLMWSYEDPPPEAEQIKGYVAFYSDLLDKLIVDGETAETPHLPHAESVYSNPLLGWLLRDAPQLETARALTETLAEQMLSAGIPLWRLAVIIPTLHPQVNALAYRWWRKDDTTEEIQIPHGVLTDPRYLNSPLVPIFEGAGGVRRRLDISEPMLDYGILEDLLAEGATDYVAMPMTFTDGQINVLTLAADRRGGFTTSDLGHIHEIIALLGRLYEVHAMRFRAASLLDTYLGSHAGARVLDGLIKRGDGENIEAIIWFCDLRDSTPLAETMPREAFLALLNRFFDAMAGAVLDNGGQVLRFIGDAALAIFPIGGSGGKPAEAGAMTPQEARERALAATDDAAQRIAAINTKRIDAGEAPIRYGMALHPGAVTYGNIGTENRLEFTVIGDAANTTARIEALCKTLDRPVLVSAAFARHFPSRVESLGRHALRGVADSQEIFALRV